MFGSIHPGMQLLLAIECEASISAETFVLMGCLQPGLLHSFFSLRAFLAERPHNPSGFQPGHLPAATKRSRDLLPPRPIAAERYSLASVTNRSPASTCVPAVTCTCSTRPSRSALTVDCIFIASSARSFWPLATESPA